MTDLHCGFTLIHLKIIASDFICLEFHQLFSDGLSTKTEAENKDKNTKSRMAWLLPHSASSSDLRDIHRTDAAKRSEVSFCQGFQVHKDCDDYDDYDNYDDYSSASHQEKWPRTVSPKTRFRQLGFSADAESSTRYEKYLSSFEKAGKYSELRDNSRLLSSTDSPAISDFSDASGLSVYDIGFTPPFLEQEFSPAYDEYQEGEMDAQKSQRSESKVSEMTTCRPTCTVQSTEEKTKTTVNKISFEVSDKVSNEENQQENLKELQKGERDKHETLAESTTKVRTADFKSTTTVFKDIIIKGISTAEEKNADNKSDQNSDEECGIESDKNVDVEERQEKERRKHEASAISTKKGADDMEIQKNTGLGAGLECYSFTFKIKLDLGEAAAVTPPQPIMEPSCSRDDYGTEEASGTCDETFSSPVFSDHWQDRVCFSAEGGRLQKQGSDVVLQVPKGAIEVNTKVTVHAAISANDVYIKHKLQLPASETIVSPLAEFWASTDFPFQKHVQITLPTCLLSNYNVDLCHVYCIRSEKPEGEIRISELRRLEELSETSGKEKPEAYFYVNKNGQVEVMTTHFSGYVCTSCFQCQNISLEVYESHNHDHGEVRVFLRAELWDRLTLREFKKCNSGNDKLVLRDTFQLKKMFTPAELLMELTVSNEQQNMWQHIKYQDVLPETRKTFQLNWHEIECKRCKNIPAIKYTELGPFCVCCMLKSSDGAMPSTLEVCVRVSHFQKQGNLEPDSSCAPVQINVGLHTEDENRFSNGSYDNTTINIQNLLGDLHLASQPSSTEKD